MTLLYYLLFLRPHIWTHSCLQSADWGRKTQVWLAELCMKWRYCTKVNIWSKGTRPWDNLENHWSREILLVGRTSGHEVFIVLKRRDDSLLTYRFFPVIWLDGQGIWTQLENMARRSEEEACEEGHRLWRCFCPMQMFAKCWYRQRKI